MHACMSEVFGGLQGGNETEALGLPKIQDFYTLSIEV